jgi:hypothetical protein
MPNIDLSILNQRQTPAFYADTLANRPAAGFVGRIFVSTNTFAFYRDNGTGWDLIGGPGTGTITGSGTSGQIALWDGASTITGDSGLTYNGTDNSLTASKFIVTGGTSSQFLKADGSVDSSSYVPYTGATASLNMGANNISGQNYFINGNGVNSGGYLGIKQYSGTSSGSLGYTSLYAALQNSLYIQYSQTDSSVKTVELSSGLLGTTPRQYQFPDADGTLALTSNILNIYNSNGTLSSERTVALNNFNLIFDGGATTARVRLDADTNVARIFSFATNNLPRFAIRVDGTESGGNTGSDYAIRRYDDAGTFVDAPLTITRSTGQSTFAKKVVIENNAGDQQLQIVSTTAPSIRLDNAQTGATKRAGLGISTAVNNFIQGSADRDYCIFNSSTTASPILFGIYDAGLTNTQEAARISPARNFLIGTTTDSGYKLAVSGSAIFNAVKMGTASQVSTATTSSGADIIVGTGADSSPAFQVWDDNSLTIPRFIVTRIGNVGIGNTTPSYKLDVTGIAASNTGFLISSGQYNNITEVPYTGIFMTGSSSPDGFGSLLISSRTDAARPIIFGNSSGSASAERMRIAASTGNLIINRTTDSGEKLQVNGQILSTSTINGTRFNSTSNIFGFFNGSLGGGVTWEIGSDGSVGNGMYLYNNSGGYALTLTPAGTLSTPGGGTSDRRTKQNIEYINDSVLDKINLLKPTKFEFIAYPNKTRRGFIAQDVLETIPDLVLGNGDEEGGTYGLDYDGILALSIKAIQELNTKIENLK